LSLGDRVTEKEISDVVNAVVLMSYGGFLIGGIRAMKPAAAAHIEANKDTKYVSQLHAQQHMNNTTLRAFVRQGLRWSWKVGGFTGIFRYASARRAYIYIYKR
jgi:hypothetical protein